MGDDSAALAGFIALASEERDRREQALAGMLDVRTVTGVAGRRFTVRAINGSVDAILPALGHVTAVVDDEVLIARIGRGWVVIGNITQAPGTGSTGGGSTPWGAISGTLSDQTDLQAVLDTIPGPAGDGSADTYARSDHQHVGPGGSAQSNILIGEGATLNPASTGQVVIGAIAESTSSFTVAFGLGSKATAIYGFAFGASTEAGNQAAALGTLAKARADRSLAIGINSQIPVDSPRSVAIGRGAIIPAATPDTGKIKVNDLIIERSDGTGATRLALYDSAGTIHWLTFGIDGRAQIDGHTIIELAEDTTPQLGGDLDLNGHAIVSGSASISESFGALILDGTVVSIPAATTVDALFVTGGITVGAMVDGRDVAADGAAQDAHIANTSNPHSVTATQVGLGNVENVAQSNRGIDLMVGPFYANDLAATTDVQANFGFFNTATAVSRANNGQRMTRAGKIVGVMVTTDAARTAGTLTARPRINGTGNSGITAVVDGTNTTSNSTFSQSGVSFSANDVLTMSMVTSSWGPTTANAVGWLVVRLTDF